MGPNWRALGEALKDKDAQRKLLQKKIDCKPLSVQQKIVKDLIDKIIQYYCESEDIEIDQSCKKLITKLEKWLKENSNELN